MNKEELLECHAMILAFAVVSARDNLNSKIDEYYNQIKNLIKKYGDEK